MNVNNEKSQFGFSINHGGIKHRECTHIGGSGNL